MALALHRGTRPAARPAVRRIALGNCRSAARLRLETDPRPVVLIGPNGAGKTSLLEAISLLAPGRGLRRARLGEMDRNGGGPWSVTARLESEAGAVEIRTAHVRDGERERRSVRIDGSDADSQAVLAETVSVVWLTPAMDRLFQEGAGERRRFLDRLVLGADPSHAAQLARYAHVLRQRTKLLRAGRFDPAWLGGLERQAAAAGVAIAAARRQTVRALGAARSEPGGGFPSPEVARAGQSEGWLGGRARRAAAAGAALAAARRQTVRAPGAARIEPVAGFPTPEIALAGQIEDWLAELPALEVEERFAAALAEARRQDAETGTTAIGPHRSDLVVHERASGRPASECSTGQQKALLVSLVLAEARLRAAM